MHHIIRLHFLEVKPKLIKMLDVLAKIGYNG